MYNSWWCQIGTTNLLCYVKEEDYEIFKAVFTYSMYHIVGELVKYVLPLPIPASIYGMVILFVGLMTGHIKLSSVKEAGKFLIEIMPVMFIPAGVGLMVSWNVLKPLLIPVGIITFVSFVAVAVATGKTAQWMIKKDEGKDHE